MKKLEHPKIMWYAGAPNGTNVLLLQMEVTHETQFTYKCANQTNGFKNIFTRDQNELHESFSDAQHEALLMASAQVTAAKLNYEKAVETMNIIAAKKEPGGGIVVAEKEAGFAT